MQTVIFTYRFICAACFFMVFGGLGAAHAQEWTGVTSGAGDANSYITLEFSQNIATPEIIQLDDASPRLVLDWDEMSAGIKGTSIGQGQTEITGQGPVLRFRYARRGLNGLRLVLEINEKADYLSAENLGERLRLTFKGPVITPAADSPADRFKYDIPIPRIKPNGRGGANPVLTDGSGPQDSPTVQRASLEIYTPNQRVFSAGEIPIPRVAPHIGVSQQSITAYNSSSRNSSSGAYIPRSSAPRKPIIVLDPGHGGYDPGAIGAKGTKEKIITTAVTARLVDALRMIGRYEVITTRERDVYVDHDDRLRIAREKGGDLFISLHADSTADGKASGASVYTLADRSKSRSKKITHTQNWILDVDLTEQTASVGDILVDLAQRKTSSHSADFAALLVGELEKDVPLVRNTHRRAGYYVLLAPDVPAVLLELGFISNQADEARLNKASEQKKIVKAVIRAINRHFDAKKP